MANLIKLQKAPSQKETGRAVVWCDGAGHRGLPSPESRCRRRLNERVSSRTAPTGRRKHRSFYTSWRGALVMIEFFRGRRTSGQVGGSSGLSGLGLGIDGVYLQPRHRSLGAQYSLTYNYSTTVSGAFEAAPWQLRRLMEVPEATERDRRTSST